MAENVVKLPAEKPDSGRRIDLRGNNRFRDLLETHAEQAAIIYDAMKLKKAADAEINAMIGNAKEVAADDFWVSIMEFDVPEHMVKARHQRTMRIRRKAVRKAR